MKQFKFLMACTSVGAFAGFVSTRPEIGVSAAFGLYTLLLAFDAIMNPAGPERPRPTVTVGDLEVEP
jgi:uncharacterized membrane protein YfcA